MEFVEGFVTLIACFLLAGVVGYAKTGYKIEHPDQPTWGITFWTLVAVVLLVFV